MKFPADHKISRGYEFIPSPASRLIIPSEAMTTPSKLGHRTRRGGSITSSVLSDDSEWEKIQFEMDEFEGIKGGTLDGGKRKMYADVVRSGFILASA